MVNLLALCLVFTSLFAAEVWSPSPVTDQPRKQQVEDVIEKEGHRVIVVETYDEDGHHNTKVSISPEQPQHQRQDDAAKFKSPIFVEKSKEKTEAATDYVRPHIGQGISHGSNGETNYPTELICDHLGKCTHRMAKVLNKAKEVAHDVVDKQKELGHEVKEGVKDSYQEKKEILHGAKEKVEDLYEKTKETASEKAYEAKEFVEDRYEKAKEKAAEKAHDAKESAHETLNKAKGSVKEGKDIGKTIRSDVAHNTAEKAESVTDEVKEKAKQVKESTKDAPTRVITFLNHVKRKISEAMSSMMGVMNLLGFAIAYGMCVWVTFISSYVLARVLPIQQFGVVQSKMYPVYFRAMAYSIGLALLGHVMGHMKRLFSRKAEMFQAYNLLASILLVLMNLLYLEPSATKAMFERMKIEKEEGRGIDSPTAESSEARREQPVTDPSGTATTTTRLEETTPTPAEENREKEEIRSRIRTMSQRLKTLNSYSSFINILTLMALTWHLVYLGQRLHLPLAC